MRRCTYLVVEIVVDSVYIYIYISWGCADMQCMLAWECGSTFQELGGPVTSQKRWPGGLWREGHRGGNDGWIRNAQEIQYLKGLLGRWCRFVSSKVLAAFFNELMERTEMWKVLTVLTQCWPQRNAMLWTVSWRAHKSAPEVSAGFGIPWSLVCLMRRPSCQAERFCLGTWNTPQSLQSLMEALFNGLSQQVFTSV